MVNGLKVTTFTVRATAEQSARWKRAAESEGFRSAGEWLAAAADAYLKARARAGRPVPLAWRRGRLPAMLASGERVTLPGFVSPPFGAFRGTADGLVRHRYSLVYTPAARILATLHNLRECKALAADLARVWVRWDGQGPEPPSQDPVPLLERHRRESL